MKRFDTSLDFDITRSSVRVGPPAPSKQRQNSEFQLGSLASNGGQRTSNGLLMAAVRPRGTVRKMAQPKRLKNNQLLEVAAEVRFSSKLPGDVILGLVYSEIKGTFGEPEALPLTQLPAQLRDADAQLKYQALYKFAGKGHTLSLGPRNVVISTSPYVD